MQLHLQPAYESLGYRGGDLPAAEAAAAELFSLPIFPEMPTKDAEYVADCLKELSRASSYN